MAGDLLAQQVAVNLGAARHEGRAETGAEGRFRLGYATLSARDLGGEARQEVIHRLRRCQPRDGRQHAEGVTGQHDDVLGVPAQRRLGRVGDEVQRIGTPHVRCQAVVVEIQRQRFGIMDHVLDHRVRHRAGRVDVRLGLGVQADGLGIASALEVEGAALGPAVFVVADQDAGRIGRERGLAGARQAEEDGGINGIARRVVGRAVHRHDAFLGQQVIQQGEDRLLVFPCVFCAADQDQLAREVQRDHRLGPAAVLCGIGLEAGAVDDGEIGGEGCQFRRIRAAQQVPDEQAMPGKFGDHPHVQTMRRVGPAEKVLHVVAAALHMRQHVGVKHVEFRGVHRRVVVPPDRLRDLGRLDDELVLGGPPRVLARGHKQRPALAVDTLTGGDGGFLQFSLGAVVIDISEPRDALVFKLHRWVDRAVVHCLAPLRQAGMACDRPLFCTKFSKAGSLHSNS